MSNAWNGKKVLIVDPSNKYLDSHTDILDSLGLDVVGTAKNGLECLQKTSELKPDLITLDIVMETMDGIECAKVLSEEYPDTKFIFVTKMTQDSILNESLKTNFSSWLFLSKPLDMNQLSIRLAKIFIGSDQQVEKPKNIDQKASGDPRLQTAELEPAIKSQQKAS